MATRKSNDVLLSHEQAEAVAKMLQDYASSVSRLSKTTKNAVVRSEALRWAEEARVTAESITSKLWSWED